VPRLPLRYHFSLSARGAEGRVRQGPRTLVNEFEETWAERQTALEALFGPTSDHVLHAVVPFYLGGQADVLIFPGHQGGVLYVTADLTGEESEQPANEAWPQYELAIAHPVEQGWGPNVISRLARYTLGKPIHPGETMDIGSAVPPPSEISAFLFADYGRFTLRGRTCGVLLCVGITAGELAACFKVGSSLVLGRLREAGVFPFTNLQRRSVWNGAPNYQ
jgi:Suppressor of fused protein (SUFU)